MFICNSAKQKMKHFITHKGSEDRCGIGCGEIYWTKLKVVLNLG